MQHTLRNTYYVLLRNHWRLLCSKVRRKTNQSSVRRADKINECNYICIYLGHFGKSFVFLVYFDICTMTDRWAHVVHSIEINARISAVSIWFYVFIPIFRRASTPKRRECTDVNIVMLKHKTCVCLSVCVDWKWSTAPCSGPCIVYYCILLPTTLYTLEWIT